MKLKARFLSIISLSIKMIAGTNSLPTWNNLEKFLDEGRPAMAYLPNDLRPFDEGLIYKDSTQIVWRGIYKGDKNVAIKIHCEVDDYDNEMKVFERLNPTNDSDIVEKHRIPKLYQHGPAFDNVYFATASTSFDGYLDDRLKEQDLEFSDSTILLIFKQVMEALKYLHSKNVQHTSIFPTSIFTRGYNIFLGNFEMAQLDGPRLMDDYEMLLEMVWDMALIPGDEPHDIKLQWFENPTVRAAFESILNTEPVQGEYGLLPDYDKIITTADDALTEIIRESGEPVLFDWLKKKKRPASGAASSRHS